MTPDELGKVAKVAYPMLGRLYGYGSKWDIHDPSPRGLVDCSGLVRWAYSQAVGILIPDGSACQYEASSPCFSPIPGDVAYFKNNKGNIDHIGIIYDSKDMIEARGIPFNKVILRPRSKWEAWIGFAGYRRFLQVHIDAPKP